jgi:spore coat polysaccharide biosynthesis protein SpsF (cytidylyltransferase family)
MSPGEGKSILVNTGNGEIAGILPDHFRAEDVEILVGSAEAVQNRFKLAAHSAMIISHKANS